MRVAFLLLAASLLALPHLPYRWGHDLTDACTWRARGSWGFLIGTEGADAGRVQTACWVRRGQADPSRQINTLLRKFPTEAELTAWRTSDADHLPLPARAAP